MQLEKRRSSALPLPGKCRIKNIMPEFSVVMGAFSYTGKYIAQRLLALGQPVKTFTRRPSVDPDQRLSVAPLDFADRDGLDGALRAATTLYNTYLVPFPRGRGTFEQAVVNSEQLIEDAVAA